MTKHVEITLIHGTFAQNASWTVDASPFCDAIIHGISGVEVTFRRLQWSGRNRIADRIAAADQLAASLNELCPVDRECTQIVIGHSHGGSVLAHALVRHPHLASAIHGIFLATPFIDARPRPYWFLAVVAFIAAFITPLSFAGGVAVNVGILSLTEPDDMRISFLFPGYILLTGALAAFIGYILPTVLLRKKPRGLAQRISTCKLPRGHYLFIRATGDEAGAALATAQFASWLFSKIVAILLRLLPWDWAIKRFDERYQKARASNRKLHLRLNTGAFLGTFSLAACLAGPGLFALPFSFPLSQNYWADFFTLFDYRVHPGIALALILVAPPLVVSAAMCLYFVMLNLFFVFTWISYRSFGKVSFWVAMCVELAVEPLPLGTHTVVHTTWAGVFSGLSHSSPYQNRQATNAIRDWIDGIVK